MPVEGVYLEAEYELGGLRVLPLTPLIGAMLEGIDLQRELPPSGRAVIEEALRRHKVLFFRGQDLAADQLVAFGRSLGRLLSYAPGAWPPGGVHPSHPELRIFDYGEARRGREAFWHFDVLPDRKPARASILRARRVPEVGGDTLFCDLAAVYRALPAARRERLQGAMGVYDFAFQRQLARFRGTAEAEVMAMLPGIPLEEMPLVIQPAGEGRRALFVNPSFLVGIRGMSAEESREVLADLRLRIAQPEVQCRFRWRAGDIAFWDNRACLHYATSNYWPARRTMERLTLLDGDGA